VRQSASIQTHHNFSSPIPPISSRAPQKIDIAQVWISASSKRYANLQNTRVDDGGLLVVLDLAGAGSSSLKSLDDVQGFLISNLTEDDVLAIEPAGDNGGDEELRAVAINRTCQLCLDGSVQLLTCWVRRWPLREVLAWCACGRSSHRRTSHRRWTFHQYPIIVSCEPKTSTRFQRTLPRVKSPPWSMNCGIIRWKEDPAYPKPFSPVQRARKFSAVFGTTSS
jgi:hypothetical protein